MNTVSIIGEVIAAPRLSENRAGIPRCRIRLAIPRYSSDGRREPGVVYVAATAFGHEAETCAERLEAGSRVGLSGWLDSDEPGWSGVAINKLEIL